MASLNIYSSTSLSKRHLLMTPVPYSQKLWRVSGPWVENFSLAQNNWINKRQKCRNCFKNVNIFNTISTSELFFCCSVGGSSCCTSLFSGLLRQSCYGPVSQLHMGTAGEHLMWSKPRHFRSLDSLTFYSAGVDTLLTGTRPLIFTHFCKQLFAHTIDRQSGRLQITLHSLWTFYSSLFQSGLLKITPLNHYMLLLISLRPCNTKTFKNSEGKESVWNGSLQGLVHIWYY